MASIQSIMIATWAMMSTINYFSYFAFLGKKNLREEEIQLQIYRKMQI